MSSSEGHRIELALTDSSAPPTTPPYRGDAPNVVVIVLDDLGFAQLGCYGSDIETPNLDRLAQRGLRFTNFHTTAVCSPTRACLLTGRNHHRVGMGMLPDMPINYPAYVGQFPDGAGTLPQILRSEGWATYAIGKWHLVPRDQRAAGPFHMWPTGVGFERYYGFLNGETNQWTPNLIRDQAHIEPPATPDQGYHLDADLADQAITHLRELRLTNPSRPFLLWYATAAPHAPHQAPPEWIDRYRGRFDAGWDQWRADTLARQKDLGIVPDATELSDRPDWVEAWEDIDPERQRLYARMMEVFAGFVSHADHHIGRVLDHIEASGEADDTIVMLVSDNGCSAEGGPHGSWNQHRHYISDEPDDLDKELAHYDDLGGFRSSGHFPWGWALAGNTPLRRWKRYTFEGGIRDPFIVSWPNGLREQAGQVRHQYCHAVDVLPTVLDLLGLEPPDVVDQVPQMSLDGTMLRDALHRSDAPDPRTSQYFECWGSRAMYHEGWKAVTDHVNQLTANERELLTGSDDFATDRWALFDTTTDFTESNDLADAHPDKLAELIALWNREAERNQVLPLDDSAINRYPALHLPWIEFQEAHHLSPGDKVHESAGPIMWGGFGVTTSFGDGLTGTDLAPDRTSIICEQGDWISGWALYLCGETLRWVMNVDGELHGIAGPVAPGVQVARITATPNGAGAFDLRLHADDVEIAAAPLPMALPMTWAPDGAFLTVGYARPFPVCDDYAPSAPAPASLRSVHIDSGPPPPFDFEAELERVMRHQ
jgi:arylsulfatase